VTRSILVFGALLAVASANAQKVKPSVRVAPDGFPVGQSTPEGAACEFARAFIKADPGLLKAVCVPSGEIGGKQYASFLSSLSQGMAAEHAKKTPSDGHPQKILSCDAMGRLSKNGPNSYAYAVLSLKDIGFVDVVTQLPKGRKMNVRTFVVETPKGKWLVFPAPQLDTILSDGLNQEKPTGISFSSKYRLVKA